jgi:glutaminyl-peptide cyclotransferase
MIGTIRRFPLMALCVCILNVSCSNSQIPVFNQDRAFEYLEKQCDFGPRNPGSEGHKKCLAFFVEELGKFADTVVKQPFMFTDYRTKKSHTLTNVIASFGRQGERVLLCAHWDTRPVADFDQDPEMRNTPILGANDGASGVAVLLEIARILKENPPPRGIDIILFDGEDSGLEGQTNTWCQGSRYFADNKGFDYRPRFGILIDMIGDKDLHIPIESYSQQYAPDLVDRVWTKAEDLGLYVFDRAMGPDVVDDHRELFRVGIPAIDIIDFDYEHWHTTQDTPDKCSPESLGIVGTLLLNLIYE